MKQFGKVLKFELKGYLTNKVFVGITLFLVAAICVVMFFPRIAVLFDRDDAPNPSEEKPVMLIVSGSEANGDIVQETFTAAFPDYEVRLSELHVDKLQEAIQKGDAECAFVMDSMTSYTYYVHNMTMYDTNTAVADEVLREIYRVTAMVQGGLTLEEADRILSAQIHHQVEKLGKDQMENFLYTYIMIMALYIVILLYGQMVATNVATEKSSRAMELLITSVKPTGMMFGKVAASCCAGLIQMVAIFGSAMLFFNLNRSYWQDNAIITSVFDMPVDLFVYMLIFFVLGFLIYAFLFAAVGSTASKLEDINTSVQPITFLFIIGFMVVVFSMSAGNVDTTLMKICSYIPFTSPMAMFTRIAMTVVPWYEIAVSIGILVVSSAGVGVLAAKIYRVGVLMYGNPPKITSLLREIWKA